MATDPNKKAQDEARVKELRNKPNRTQAENDEMDKLENPEDEEATV